MWYLTITHDQKDPFDENKQSMHQVYLVIYDKISYLRKPVEFCNVAHRETTVKTTC